MGLDVSDEPKIAADLLRAHGATFPNVVDTGEEARALVFDRLQTLKGMSAVPMHYLVGRDGKVLDAWYGPRTRDDLPDLLKGTPPPATR